MAGAGPGCSLPGARSEPQETEHHRQAFSWSDASISPALNGVVLASSEVRLWITMLRRCGEAVEPVVEYACRTALVEMCGESGRFSTETPDLSTEFFTPGFSSGTVGFPVFHSFHNAYYYCFSPSDEIEIPVPRTSAWYRNGSRASSTGCLESWKFRRERVCPENRESQTKIQEQTSVSRTRPWVEKEGKAAVGQSHTRSRQSTSRRDRGTA